MSIRQAFVCRECGAMFTEPDVKIEAFDHAFGTEHFKVPICPECSSDDIEECEECGNGDCVNAKEPMSNLCKGCKAKLKEKLVSFFATLSDKELDQFDDWIEGNSIHSVESWKV